MGVVGFCMGGALTMGALPQIADLRLAGNPGNAAAVTQVLETRRQASWRHRATYDGVERCTAADTNG